MSWVAQNWATGLQAWPHHAEQRGRSTSVNLLSTGIICKPSHCDSNKIVGLQLHTDLKFIMFIPYAMYISAHALQRGTPETCFASKGLGFSNNVPLLTCRCWRSSCLSLLLQILFFLSASQLASRGLLSFVLTSSQLPVPGFSCSLILIFACFSL